MLTRWACGCAQDTPKWSHDKCSVCSGDVKAWPDERIHRRCSWCLARTAHTIKTRNKIRRSVYSCEGCGKEGLTCKACVKDRPLELAMAKDTVAYSFDDCVVCKGEVEAWPPD